MDAILDWRTVHRHGILADFTTFSKDSSKFGSDDDRASTPLLSIVASTTSGSKEKVLYRYCSYK